VVSSDFALRRAARTLAVRVGDWSDADSQQHSRPEEGNDQCNNKGHGDPNLAALL